MARTTCVTSSRRLGLGREPRSLPPSGLGAATLGGAHPAVSAPLVGGADCPEPVPVSELVEGQPVTGLTVSRGTTPEPFTGSVLGVLDDGIAPGVDMILVDLTSAEIDRVGGIWAGHVRVAGVRRGRAPARRGRLRPDLGELAGRRSDAGRGDAATPRRPGHRRGCPRAGAAPAADGARRRRDRAASRAQAEAGLSRLTVPVAVSGCPARVASTSPPNASGSTGSASTPPAPRRPGPGDVASIVPGGNIGASWAYGDFSAVATGTVTAVCGDQVLAFGHPMSFIGATTHDDAQRARGLRAGGHHRRRLQDREPHRGGRHGRPGPARRDQGLPRCEPARTSLVTTHVTPTDSGLCPHVVRPGSACRSSCRTPRRWRCWPTRTESSTRSVPVRRPCTSRCAASTRSGEPFLLDRSNRFVSRLGPVLRDRLRGRGAVAVLLDNPFTDVTVDEVTVTTRVGEATPRDAGAHRLGQARRFLGAAGEGRRGPQARQGRSCASARHCARRRVDRAATAGGASRRGGPPVSRAASCASSVGSGCGGPATPSRPAASRSSSTAAPSAPRNDELYAVLDLFGSKRAGSPAAVHAPRRGRQGQAQLPGPDQGLNRTPACTVAAAATALVWVRDDDEGGRPGRRGQGRA